MEWRERWTRPWVEKNHATRTWGWWKRNNSSRPPPVPVYLSSCFRFLGNRFSLSNYIKHFLLVLIDSGQGTNRQVWPWGKKWTWAKANRALSREHAGHSKHPFPTIQETTLHMDMTRWSISKSDWLCSLHCRQRNSTLSSKTISAADCSLDHELLIAKFKLKLKKVGKTTRSFKYDLNLIPYDSTVEGTNRFKGLDPVERVLEELWTGSS